MTDESTKDARDLVNSLIDDLEDRGWNVRSYNPRVDPYEPVGLELDIEYPAEPDEPVFESQQDRRNELKDLRSVIEELDDGLRDQGAPENEVISQATDALDRTEQEGRTGITKLQAKGEVYEPAEGYYRVT